MRMRKMASVSAVWSASIVWLLTALALSGDGAAQSADFPPQLSATTITVNIGQDINTSQSETCTAFPAACSLRRAIVQARALPPASRPVTIRFNIPTSDASYDAGLQIWKLNILAPSDTYVFRDLAGGQIIIDGTTQPNGRSSGPKIILVGPATAKSGLKVGAVTNDNQNQIIGLGFQNFSTSVQVNSNNNTISNNWFGLNDNGTLPAWRNPSDHSQGSGNTGISLAAGITGNTIQNNVILGMIGNASTIRGNANIFTNNYVGTTAAGTTPGKQTSPALLCTEVDWYGGSGLLADGPDHILQNNVIAGIRLDVFASSSQPDAIWVESTCDRCVIRNNRIGVTATNQDVGVCGIGIDITNGEQVDVLNNTFANTVLSALFLNGALYKDNTLTGNIIRRSTPWAAPNDAIQRFSGLPDPFEFFKPAKVTSIKGTAVSGTAGDGSPCPNCIIEIFLDDDDGITEALQSLGTATANAGGNWTFALATPLAPGFGLRTTSTTAQFNTIPNMNAGTTVGLSELYKPLDKSYLPLIKK